MKKNEKKYEFDPIVEWRMFDPDGRVLGFIIAIIVLISLAIFF